MPFFLISLSISPSHISLISWWNPWQIDETSTHTRGKCHSDDPVNRTSSSWYPVAKRFVLQCMAPNQVHHKWDLWHIPPIVLINKINPPLNMHFTGFLFARVLCPTITRYISDMLVWFEPTRALRWSRTGLPLVRGLETSTMKQLWVHHSSGTNFVSSASA